MNIFLQAFDEGWLTDGRGKKVYLSDAIVIMTSNLGSENFKKYEKPAWLRQEIKRRNQRDYRRRDESRRDEIHARVSQSN
jgi:ATP-dependent Clp protease ATP-binding subunit ClpA